MLGADQKGSSGPAVETKGRDCEKIKRREWKRKSLGESFRTRFHSRCYIKVCLRSVERVVLMSVVHVLKWVLAKLYEYGMSVCVIDVMNSVGKANLKLTQQATSY